MASPARQRERTRSRMIRGCAKEQLRSDRNVPISFSDDFRDHRLIQRTRAALVELVRNYDTIDPRVRARL